MRALSQTWLGGERERLKQEGENVTRHFPGSLRIYLDPHVLTHNRTLRALPLPYP